MDWIVYLRKRRLTAADLVGVVRAVHVVVALLVFPDALTVGAGELIGRTANCNTSKQNKTSKFSNGGKIKTVITDVTDTEDLMEAWSPVRAPFRAGRRLPSHLHTCSHPTGPGSWSPRCSGGSGRCTADCRTGTRTRSRPDSPPRRCCRHIQGSRRIATPAGCSPPRRMCRRTAPGSRWGVLRRTADRHWKCSDIDGEKRHAIGRRSPPQDSSSCSSTRWTGHEQRVVPSPFTMQMWEQPPLSHVHGCLPGTRRRHVMSVTKKWRAATRPAAMDTHCTLACPARGRRGCRSGRRYEPGSWCVPPASSCRCVRSSAAACRSSKGGSRTPSDRPAAGCWSRRSRSDWLLKRERGGKKQRQGCREENPQ